MKTVPEDSAISILWNHFHCWKRFVAECQHRPIINKALVMCANNQARKRAAGRFTAFEILEPEAQAWLSYFKQTGNFTQSSDTNHMEGV